MALGIGFSPRPGGNSDLMLEWALSGAKEAGAKVKRIFVRDLKINYCLGCRYCESEGECIQKDDFQKFAKELERADGLIISTPIFFLNLPGHSKAMIDRFQTYWSRKYLLARPPRREERKALVLISAGSDLENVFDCAKRTLRAFFQVAGFQAWKELGINAVDEKAAVRKISGLEKRIQKVGHNLVRSKSVKLYVSPDPNY